MLALALHRASRCNQCGGDLAETTSPDNDGSPGNGVYLPLLPVRCHRCTALSKSEERYRKDKAEHPHALMHRVELRPGRAAT